MFCGLSKRNDVMEKHVQKKHISDQLSAFMSKLSAQSPVKKKKRSSLAGAGSCLDRHTEGLRNLTFPNAVKEAVVDWSAPEMHEADPFISNGLDVFFKDKPWHFKPKDSNDSLILGQSVDTQTSTNLLHF